MKRTLCTYSRSDLLASEVLPECPIELTRPEHDHCPCRRRETVTVGQIEVRVLTCTWPRKWNGQEIINPPVFAEATRRRIAEKLEVERLMSQQKKPPAVATADPAPAIDPPIPDAEVTAVVPATPGGGQLAEVQATEFRERTPTNLAMALARAQQKCKPVRKDARNSHHGYRYASAEAVIAEAKAALADTGLALVPIEQSLERTAEGTGYELVRKFLLIHESGQSVTLSCAWPVIEERGRPVDKATAISSTASLAYMLRDLLLMPRVADEADLAGRKDAAAPVSGRALLAQREAEKAAAEKAAQQPAPPASASEKKGGGPITAQQLEKLASLRLASISTLKPADPETWWREFLAGFGVTTARSLGEAEARDAIGKLAHALNCADMEAGLGESTGRT